MTCNVLVSKYHSPSVRFLFAARIFVFSTLRMAENEHWTSQLSQLMLSCTAQGESQVCIAYKSYHFAKGQAGPKCKKSWRLVLGPTKGITIKAHNDSEQNTKTKHHREGIWLWESKGAQARKKEHKSTRIQQAPGKERALPPGTKRRQKTSTRKQK